jgi:hypothetical protein
MPWKGRLTRRRFLAIAGTTAGVGSRWELPVLSNTRLGWADPRSESGRHRDGSRFDIAHFNDLTVSYPRHQAALSPDGRLLAHNTVRLCDWFYLPGVGEPEFETGAPAGWVVGAACGSQARPRALRKRFLAATGGLGPPAGAPRATGSRSWPNTTGP